MAFLQNARSLLAVNPTPCRFSRLSSCLRESSRIPASLHFYTTCSIEHPPELFNYTSGRWIWNDASKHLERRRFFNVSELKHLAASAVNQNVEDVARFEKLGEGGFNRTFLVTMHDGFQLVVRIPYSTTEPKRLVIASEVATMDFLRSHGVPVPKIYSYSVTSENPAGTEYLITELVRGSNLGDIWYDLSEKARITVVSRLVELESQIFALQFPANGNLYYSKDLNEETRRVEVPTVDLSHNTSFCVGPDTRLSLWYGRRAELNIDRSPFDFGHPVHPFHRLHRELFDYQKISPSEHVRNLHKYLQAVPYITPNDDVALTRPTLRHPDLEPNNVFVSDDLSITGLIDWQHSAILPLFLQCGIPNSLQNYGDSSSESLTPPELPGNFDNLDENKQFEEVLLIRRRQLHYFYVATTAKLNTIHYDALTHEFSTLRRKAWPNIIANDDSRPVCPISFSEDEVDDCVRLSVAQAEADKQLQACRDFIGIGPEGWVPVDQYEEVKQRESKLKADALEAAESEQERLMLQEHWMFADFDEDEYS
ncbi:kinase-like domain-containing protein [Paraphoma chrysanthemicola]|uniref:Kinase-like domain-containing protein n=1 Tax=Paraphoma chrysanthemicola TaxID=798071 RepID=A0A8K0R3J9_9PLEO|nr:kinase-like domain-containing protein [Paraphoma chrysanthemicola]